MLLTGFLVKVGALPADRGGGTAVALVGCDEFDAAVTVPVVVPIHEGHRPFTGLVFAGERPTWVVGPVLKMWNRDSE